MTEIQVEASGPRARPEAWLSTVLRVLVHAITAAVIAWPLTLAEAVIAAAVGGAVGSFGARFVARSALRLPSIALLGAAGLVGVLALEWAVVDLDLVPTALGPAGALRVGDSVVFGLGALVVSGTLRSLSSRRPSLSVLEAALVAGGFATLLASHRNGAIHRPYELADEIIARGEDPTLAILIIGAVGAVVIGMLLLSERSLLRSAFHLGVVAILLLVILQTTAVVGLPTPPSTGGALGLQDADESSQGGSGGGSAQSQGRRNSDELEFMDEYPGGGGAPDAVIIFHDDYSPPGGYYYFRQTAFSQYNGRKLVTAGARDIDADVRNRFPTNRARDVGWTPGAGRDRTSVETTVAMMADNSAPVGLESPERFVPATNPSPDRFRRMYRTHSVSLTSDPTLLLGREAGDPAWDEATRAHYVEGPADPRYRALAERIVAELPDDLREDPMVRALAITRYLGQHGTYSLRSRHATAEDPTADFLFGDLTGYCVHFAHAAVFLMRAAGLPARVGTGYAVAESNRQGGSALLLRNSDQHAWPEVYVGPAPPMPPPEQTALEAFTLARREGMADLLPPLVLELAMAPVEQRARVIAPDAFEGEPPPALELDPDRGPFGDDEEGDEDDELDAERAELRLLELARRTSRTPEVLLAEAAAAFETGQRAEGPGAGWVVTDVAPENVLDGAGGDPPDPQLQRLLGEMARGSQPIDDAPQPPRAMRELVESITGPLGWGSLSLLGLLVVLASLVKLWRRIAPSFVSGPAAARVIYRAALDRLSEDGRRRRWGESPEAFARREASSLPALRPLTDGHLAAAFGGHYDAARLRRMVEASNALRREHRRAVPLWRRTLGALNPFSWLLTR